VYAEVELCTKKSTFAALYLSAKPKIISTEQNKKKVLIFISAITVSSYLFFILLFYIYLLDASENKNYGRNSHTYHIHAEKISSSLSNGKNSVCLSIPRKTKIFCPPNFLLLGTL